MSGRVGRLCYIKPGCFVGVVGRVGNIQDDDGW